MHLYTTIQNSAFPGIFVHLVMFIQTPVGGPCGFPKGDHERGKKNTQAQCKVQTYVQEMDYYHVLTTVDY